MKICRFNGNRVGVVQGADVIDITPALNLSAQWPLPSGDMVIRQLVADPGLAGRALETGARMALAEVRLDSPVANPGKIIGAPINYHAHISEANADKAINHGKTFTSLDQFGLFLKAGTSLIGPDDQVRLRFPDRRNDHEVELAVIIGKEARFVRRENALDYVAGYSIGLDMTVRGPEFPGFRKSIDSYAVLGPWLVTADEIADPNRLALGLNVNGDVRQKSSTERLIFNVQHLIEYASAFYTLEPGDVIMTGTPEGVSQVHPGDHMHAWIEGLGSLDITIAPEFETV